MTNTAPTREGQARLVLAARQRQVLDDLLAGRVPDGFDPAGARATTRVLHAKRSSAALNAAPEVAELSHWRSRFHAWAAANPSQGCAHEDLRAFASSLGHEGAEWLRLHGVHEGQRRWASVRLGPRRILAVGIRGHVWTWAWPRPPEETDRQAHR